MRAAKGATWGGLQGPWERSARANAKGAGPTGYMSTRVNGKMDCALPVISLRIAMDLVCFALQRPPSCGSTCRPPIDATALSGLRTGPVQQAV